MTDSAVPGGHSQLSVVGPAADSCRVGRERRAATIAAEQHGHVVLPADPLRRQEGTQVVAYARRAAGSAWN